jgi:DNA polymerase III epsilon subunit-like protein
VTLPQVLTRTVSLARDAWRQLFGSDAPARRFVDTRFVVVDVDVTGTSVRRDRVTGIAALPVTAGTFRLSDLRYCALPDAPGAPDDEDSRWRRDFLALRDLAVDSPIVTYNPDFVRRMIARACRAHRLPALDGEWVDVAAAAGVVRDADNALITMDYWLEKMKSGGRRPHDATYDAFAMAQLLQAVLAYAEDAGIDTVEALARRQDSPAWFRGG